MTWWVIAAALFVFFFFFTSECYFCRRPLVLCAWKLRGSKTECRRCRQFGLKTTKEQK